MSAAPSSNTGVGFGFSAGLGGASAIGQGITSFILAGRQAGAVDQAMASQRQAARRQAGQISEAAALTMAQRRREAEQIRGRIRVAAAEAGTTTGAFSAQMRQADFDAALNTQTIEANRRARLQRLESSTNANLLQLASGRPSPGMAAATGALRGLGSGLQLGGTLDRMQARQNQQDSLARREQNLSR